MDLEDPSAMRMGDRLRRNAALISRQLGDDWRVELAEEMGCDVSDVGVGPVSRVRDSDPLAESNFRVLLRDLRSVDERVTAVRFGHWGFGWTEEIAVPLDNPSVTERVEQWVEQLQNYPAADDLDLAELETEYGTDDEPLIEPSSPQGQTSELLRRLDALGSSDPPDLGL